MLNELCHLADALERAGIAPKDWDQRLNPLPKATTKKPCYRIRIATDGHVSSIDELPLKLVPDLRKWEPSNGSSFPGFNIKPLYRIAFNEKFNEQKENRKKLKTWQEGKASVDIQLLREWCVEENNNWDENVEKKITKCLEDIPRKLSELIDVPAQESDNAIPQLLERILQKEEPFRHTLEEYLWKVIENSESITRFLPLLIHNGAFDKNPKNDRGAVSVYLDIPDWKKHPVASLNSMVWLNERLIEGSLPQADAPDAMDAFGQVLTGENEKLPSVKLPIISAVKLRAMNSESLCQKRYGTIDAASYPVGQISRKRAKGALEWLGNESREGETWGKADLKELIFAYPVQLPNVSLKLATCFGARKNNDQDSRFANAAQNVVKGLRGVTTDLNSIELKVFSLKKMDKARTKVVFHRNYTAQRLVDAAQEWIEGCENIPDISIRAWGDKKGEWSIVDLQTPFPLQVAQCLNRIWKHDGTTECETPIISRSQGIELFLDERPERFVPHLLCIALQNGRGMFLSLGNTLHRNAIISIKGHDSQKLLLPSLLGLLLHKVGIRKENYMNNTPFLVGGMLKLADELHALYCKDVRDNNLPPQLVGNTLMTAALESPTQALAQLALRLKPYYGWAQTFCQIRRDNDSEEKTKSRNLAGYFIALYRDVASELAEHELPARFGDTERAQLLLGYLAANPKRTKSNENKPQIQRTKKQEEE